jgi:hypothetical protein
LTSGDAWGNLNGSLRPIDGVVTWVIRSVCIGRVAIGRLADLTCHEESLMIPE